MTGHEFHRSVVVEDRPGRSPAWMWRDSSGRPARHGHVTGGVHASYLHLYPAAHPAAVAGSAAAADVFQHTAPDHTLCAMTEPIGDTAPTQHPRPDKDVQHHGHNHEGRFPGRPEPTEHRG